MSRLTTRRTCASALRTSRFYTQAICVSHTLSLLARALLATYFALGELHLEPRVLLVARLDRHFDRSVLDAVDERSALELLDLGLGHGPAHLRAVHARDLVLRVLELARVVAVVRKEQEPFSVEVEAALGESRDRELAKACVCVFGLTRDKTASSYARRA